MPGSRWEITTPACMWFIFSFRESLPTHNRTILDLIWNPEWEAHALYRLSIAPDTKISPKYHNWSQSLGSHGVDARQKWSREASTFRSSFDLTKIGKARIENRTTYVRAFIHEFNHVCRFESNNKRRKGSGARTLLDSPKFDSDLAFKTGPHIW